LEIHKSTEITINLRLNLEEAAWLKNVMQNPISGQNIDEEHYDSIMRHEFFTVLKDLEG